MTEQTADALDAERAAHAETSKDRDHWKANHENVVKLKRRSDEIKADVIATLRAELDAARAARDAERRAP
jgi:hypothetical protein